jgi:hypothetical protein
MEKSSVSPLKLATESSILQTSNYISHQSNVPLRLVKNNTG